MSDKANSWNYVRGEATFVSSAAFFKELPKISQDEFAILGRSNVGKSSFINHVLENKSLARVSKRPGKTSLANIYKIDEVTYWVDLPGYGYAKTSGNEKERWSRLIAEYCEKRPNLKGILWLLDIRHPGLEIDIEAAQWLRSINRAILPVLTKADKESRSAQIRLVKEYKQIYSFENTPVTYSILEHSSRERFWDQFAVWRKQL